MAFRLVASAYGAIATMVGFVLMGWGPMFLKYLGTLVGSDYGSFSLIRFAGAGFFLAGFLLIGAGRIEDEAAQRWISVSMVAGHAIAGLIVLAQQIAIWCTLLGAALTLWFWLAALSFALPLIAKPVVSRRRKEF